MSAHLSDAERPNHVRRLRRLQKRTQAQLAARAGISVRTLHTLETTSHHVRLEAKLRVLKALHIPIDFRHRVFPELTPLIDDDPIPIQQSDDDPIQPSCTNTRQP